MTKTSLVSRLRTRLSLGLALRAGSLLLLGAAYAAQGGCGALASGAVTLTESAAALDSAEAAGQTAALASIAIDAAASSTTGATAAINAKVAIPLRFSNPSCVASVMIDSNNPNVISYNLSGCSGPYGLINLTGNLTITYTYTSPTQFTVSLASTSPLKVGAGSLTIGASATVNAGATNVTIDTSSVSVGAQSQQTITHSGAYSATWANNCLTLNGMYTTTDNGNVDASTLTNYMRCQGMCPTSGTFTFDAVSATNTDVITVTYGGTTTAQVSIVGPNGSVSGKVNLACGS